MAQLLSNKTSIIKHATRSLKALQRAPVFCLKHTFPTIKSCHDTKSPNALNNAQRNIELSNAATALREKVIEKGQNVPKREKGLTKLSTYERMSLLADPDHAPLLLSVTAGEGMGRNSVNSAGILIAIVKVMGKYCIINANDWSSKGGTLYPISLKKQLRAQEISKMNRLPIMYIVDSGGAFLPLQVSIIIIHKLYNYTCIIMIYSRTSQQRPGWVLII